jgi:hypothetical protein
MSSIITSMILKNLGGGGADIDLSNLSVEGLKKVATAWAYIDGTGTPSVINGFNVSSVTDVATGVWAPVFTTDMADTDYVVLGVAEDGGNLQINTTANKLVGSCGITCRNSGNTLIDSSQLYVFFIGG